MFIFAQIGAGAVRVLNDLIYIIFKAKFDLDICLVLG